MRIFEFKTVQTGPIKTLFEALKDILEDVNIEIRAPSKEKENGEEIGGVRIIALSSSKHILVRLKLHASKFDSFICNVPRKVISVSMANLHLLLKSGNNNDVSTFFLDDSDTNHLGIRFENHDKKCVRNLSLQLLDLEEDQVKIPQLTYSSMITMPSNDFSKICRDMSNLSDIIEITNVGDTIKFSCKGDFASETAIFGSKDNSVVSINRSKNNNEVINGIYDMKHLLLFTKCTGLCNNIEILIENDIPLTIVYNVGDLGNLRFCLSEKIRDDIEDIDDDILNDNDDDE